ncbi:protease pro-enzyme activation domain-containing protein [Duganella violaceipulchra]|uniref:Kumamolisin n=1 Tax=Duganella violaceipulchra TaxID=2849652 RepID=A0AA41HC68_9BURK|nr:S53 family peptidase [Duganella violaceicalia]MBV6324599.1 S53 family peptidase [Duganella violaceicalia]MCP2009307.1 kumamolisin [Duganella violaceicalia]
MATTSTPHIIPGSGQLALQGAVALGPVADAQTIEITVRLRAAPDRAPLDLQAATADAQPVERQYLSREQFAQAHGASDADIAKVTAFAAQHGMAVISSDAAQRRVVLAGTAAQMSAAFGVQLEEYEYPDGSYRGRTGELSVPDALAGVVEGVFGLDDRPVATPKFQRLQADGFASAAAANIAFSPPQLARLYNFPQGLDGSGQCIGIIELGGGSRPRDLKIYFGELGLPAPRVKSVCIDHAKNRPTTANSADGEVMLDIEVAGAVAPGALIAVYYAPNTERGFLDAITAAVHDAVNQPSVISISWGAPESAWTGQAMTAFEQAFADAAAMGVTILCAAGDNGSTDGVSDGAQHVDFPASAPHALACGGTRVLLQDGGQALETVWNSGPNSATGGGYSSFFGVPDYQQGVVNGHAARGVPDVAGDADPASGYKVRVDGQNLVFGGTSAVAPLWAGLLALINQRLGRPVGFLHPLLYGSLQGRGVTRDVTNGNNGAQQAVPGWDACTGWGCPDGEKLLQALSD